MRIVPSVALATLFVVAACSEPGELPPTSAGPGPADGSSIAWLYHSHVMAIQDSNSGLIGAMIITAKGMANPDGSPIPGWLSIPVAKLPTKGHIGFQGKHAGAPIAFRNLKIKELPAK